VTYGGRHDCFRFRKHPSSLFKPNEPGTYLEEEGVGLGDVADVHEELTLVRVVLHVQQHKVGWNTGTDGKKLSEALVVKLIMQNILIHVNTHLQCKYYKYKCAAYCEVYFS